ncbi:MAG: hypothetical protein ACI8PV_001797 [Dinoroseobacter sp.]
MDTEIVGTNYLMRLINVSDWEEKMQLKFKSNIGSAVPEDIYLVAGEVARVKLDNELKITEALAAYKLFAIRHLEQS